MYLWVHLVALKGLVFHLGCFMSLLGFLCTFKSFNYFLDVVVHL